jgi:hypothetical protein
VHLRGYANFTNYHEFFTAKAKTDSGATPESTRGTRVLHNTMNKSESITHLAAALAKAQAEMPVAVFDATNPFLKSKYASLGAVIQASRPILAKHKLSLVQFPISDAAGIGVESILTHESGEFVAERISIPLTEEKGKSKVQSAGSTLTYLRRYSWASILGMYSDEDSDAGNLPVGNAAAPQGASAPAKQFSPKPATALPPPPLNKNSNS